MAGGIGGFAATLEVVRHVVGSLPTEGMVGRKLDWEVAYDATRGLGHSFQVGWKWN